MEKWQISINFPKYEVSTYGRVKTRRRIRWNGAGWQYEKEMIMRMTIDEKGYSRIKLRKGKKTTTLLVHRLIYSEFTGKKLKFEGQNLVLHRDETLINGALDNRLDNLWAGTYGDNNKDCITKGRAVRCKGETRPQTSLTNQEALEIYKRANSGESGLKLAKEFNTSHTVIYGIKNKRYWKNIHFTI